MTDSPQTLEGFISILAALQAGSRPIHQLFIHDKKRYDKRLAFLRHRAEEQSIPVDYVSTDTLASYTEGQSHGGVVALVGERQFVSLTDLIPTNDPPYIVMLDGIEDPYNFGYALRSIYASGAHGVVVPQRNWFTATTVVARASAGASEHLPMAIAESIYQAGDTYRVQGLHIACTSKGKGTVSVYDVNLSQPLFLLIGGERRGIARAFLDKADSLIEIPYGRDFEQSLGMVGATSILSFEVMRQRIKA